MITKTQLIEGMKLVLPIFTTFLGAGLAFFWQNFSNDKRQERANYAVLLKTQALFYEFYGVILSLRREYMPEYKDNKERALSVKHMSFYDKFPGLDFEGLSFILATESPDLYDDIVNAYRKCQSAIDSIKERNQQYAKIGGGAATPEDLEKGKVTVRMSPVDFLLLRDFTDIMYREVDHALVRINKIDVKLQEFIKANFKGKHALKAVPIEGVADGKV